MSLRGHDRSEIRRQRVVMAAERLQYFGQTQARHVEGRLQRHAARQRGVCLLKAAMFALQDTQIGQRGRIVRMCCERPLKQGLSFGGVVATMRADRQKIEGVGVGRFIAQQFGERAFGIRRAAVVGERERRRPALGQCSRLNGSFGHGDAIATEIQSRMLTGRYPIPL